jgi:hypothetical protein
VRAEEKCNDQTRPLPAVANPIASAQGRQILFYAPASLLGGSFTCSRWRIGPAPGRHQRLAPRGGAMTPPAFWPSLLSLPASSFEMFAVCRQTSSSDMSVTIAASGPAPQMSNW